MNSSDDDDILGIESTADSEGNLNTKNQSEGRYSKDSLIFTNEKSQNDSNESEQETSKEQEKLNKIPREEVHFLKTYKEKKQQKLKFQYQKRIYY